MFGVALALSGGPAAGQTVIGGDSRPNVIIDFGVLDRVGQPTPLPNLLAPGTKGLGSAPQASAPRSADSVVLTPPAPKPAVKRQTVRKAKKPATKVAAQPQEAAPAPAKPDEAKPETVKTAGADVKVSEAAQPSTVPPPPAPVAPPPPAPQPPAPVVTAPAAPETAKAAPSKAAPVKAAPTPEIAPSPAPAPLAPPPAQAAAEAAPAVPQAPGLTPPPMPEPAAPAQAASVAPNAGMVARGDDITLLFEGDSARLPDGSRNGLTELAQRLEKDAALQVQLVAYAEGDEASASKARRLSLSRALAVRSFLMDQGVRSTRIEVRALGNKIADGPADRVDVVVQKP